jgi:hypothetical protein
MELSLGQIIELKDSVETYNESTLRTSEMTFALGKAVRVFLENWTDFVQTEQKLIEKYDMKDYIVDENQLKIETEEDKIKVEGYFKERIDLLKVVVDIPFPEVYENEVQGNILNGRQSMLLTGAGIIKEVSTEEPVE